MHTDIYVQEQLKGSPEQEDNTIERITSQWISEYICITTSEIEKGVWTFDCIKTSCFENYQGCHGSFENLVYYRRSGFECVVKQLWMMLYKPDCDSNDYELLSVKPHPWS